MQVKRQSYGHSRCEAGSGQVEHCMNQFIIVSRSNRCIDGAINCVPLQLLPREMQLRGVQRYFYCTAICAFKHMRVETRAKFAHMQVWTNVTRADTIRVFGSKNICPSP